MVEYESEVSGVSEGLGECAIVSGYSRFRESELVKVPEHKYFGGRAAFDWKDVMVLHSSNNYAPLKKSDFSNT